MFRHLFTFELRYWLRQPMVYVFLLVNVLMFAWAAASDDLTIGGTFGNIYKNAPYVIQNQYGTWCIFALLMTTAFVQSAAIRDFTYKTHQIVFASPIRKFDYLAGRFFGSFVVSLIPFLGISLGIILRLLDWAGNRRYRCRTIRSHHLVGAPQQLPYFCHSEYLSGRRVHFYAGRPDPLLDYRLYWCHCAAGSSADCR
ncbi:ABC transporter permease [Spirosoma sp. KNUC1025]|uniref:ABC transporter permease n=1 Tax=Spirosoma sp. KNUC1025 TaxID=2894082 RepID=UPI003863109C|nr:hypothetical protein LN737_06660 [Spirosoma sp. KNUC1025]